MSARPEIVRHSAAKNSCGWPQTESSSAHSPGGTVKTRMSNRLNPHFGRWAQSTNSVEHRTSRSSTQTITRWQSAVGISTNTPASTSMAIAWKAPSKSRKTNRNRCGLNWMNCPRIGMHLIQVQAENGLFSNDFIFHVTQDADAAAELKQSLAESQVDVRDALANAIARGDVDEVKKRLANRPRRINDRRPATGSTPLGDAAFHGNLEIVKLLIDQGADVNATNRDGNTPLIVAAFMCRTEVVRVPARKRRVTDPQE